VTKGLPDDLLSIPGKDSEGEQMVDKVGANKRGKKQPVQSQKWGPTLVEKRPSRRPQDGRTILKIAKGRKKLSNLEVNPGMAKPKNSLSQSGIIDIHKLAAEIGI
jgi:hypothetical protein